MFLTGTEDRIRSAFDAFLPQPGRFKKRLKALQAELAEAEQAERDATEAVRPFIQAATDASDAYEAMLEERDTLLDRAADGDMAARKKFLTIDAELAIARRRVDNLSRRRSMAEVPRSSAAQRAQELRFAIDDVQEAINRGLDTNERPRGLFS